MSKFINPFTDVGFKRIFGQEINKDLLIDFLNALLKGERSVKDIRFLDKELLPEFEKDRGLIYDIYCTDENGDEFIVEMQNKEHVNFRERTLYYLSQAIARQGERGSDWKFALKAVYGVFFLNFQLTDLASKFRTDIVLEDRDTHELFTDKMRYIFLELPLFDKEENECETDFERWIYVLKNMETLQRLPFKARNAVFKRLEDIVDIASMSKEDRIRYDESIKVYRDRLAIMEFERMKGKAEGIAEGMAQGIVQGKAEGMAQGIAQGKAEGMAEGMAQGKAEGMAEGKEEIARNLKQMGMDVQTIVQATGLDQDFIDKL